MIDIYSLFLQVLILIILLVPGVVVNKMGADGGFAKGLSNLVLYFAQPALIIAPFIRPFDKALLPGMLGVFVFSFAAHIIFFLLSRPMFKKNSEKTASALRFSIVFSNAGYMGIPLIEAVLGSEAAIYATVYCVSFNVFLWSLGSYIYTHDTQYIKPKKIFVNPSMLAIYAALIIFVLPIDSFIPSAAVSIIDMLKALVAPLSMIIVGYHMANADLKALVKSGSLWLAVATRLFLCPTVIFAVMKIVSILGIYHNEMAATVVLIASSTPAATATSMFAEKFDGDTKTTGAVVPISTILAVASMPLCALLLKFY